MTALQIIGFIGLGIVLIGAIFLSKDCHEQSFKWGFQEGYEYALNKVYKYIEEHIFDFPWYDPESELSSTDIVEEIRNVMEE